MVDPHAALRARLARYYAHYAPERLEALDAQLPKFIGREEEVFAMLVVKYGPEQPAVAAAAAPAPPAPRGAGGHPARVQRV
jgi:hypothetical protein